MSAAGLMVSKRSFNLILIHLPAVVDHITGSRHGGNPVIKSLHTGILCKPVIPQIEPVSGPGLATAGGKNTDGLADALAKLVESATK